MSILNDLKTWHLFLNYLL